MPLKKCGSGSSPLTRGTPYCFQLFNVFRRFIPAYAGNSGSDAYEYIGNPVHPRLRGELPYFFERLRAASGSSPLTRGTQTLRPRLLPLWRFIPAYAGNSIALLTSWTRMTVHPRLRGELTHCFRLDCARGGSSPLTRGTLEKLWNVREETRFIPAYAGNSLKQGIEHLTNSSKDFLSGKYAKNPETVLNHFKNSSLD